ncbi:MAG TPA: TauD/TfdA family dioxygenase [Acidimicrobiales bacterium]
MGGCEITPVSGALGAEVRGIDLRRPLADEQVAELRQLLLEHLVLFFPDQHLTPSQHRAFAASFGELECSWNHVKVDDDHPEISVISSARGTIADVWHLDQSYFAVPNAFGSLNMITAPPRGGDTIWSNQYLVYERLSDPFKRLLEGLTAVHVSTGDSSRVAHHPAVIVHPETGRRAVFVSTHHVKEFVELTRDESETVLQHLARKACEPEVTCRYRWREGTVNIWDNRCTQHYAVNDYDGLRVMHRATVKATAAPMAAVPSPHGS